ncbi:MAG TPA: Dickkopf N-terminal cysteine-rich domain-containing protein [Vulgatibacter sp.]|nr:Dickkopf N-terminal cysteine-rich domain-containing protein [Vulgatibacter sp.]
MVTTSIRTQVVAFALALGAGACDGDRGAGAGPHGGSAHGLEAGEACSVHEECRPGLSCDPVRRVCVCRSDSHCPGGLKCNPFSGTCVAEVPGCLRDADCGADQWCDVATRVCAPLQPFCGPCSRDEDCGTRNRCLRGEDGRRFCGKSCNNAVNCPGGSSCVQGQCVPDEGCASLVPCTPDTLQPCASSADCTQGKDQLCEPATAVCVARRSGCEAGFACDATFECVPGCLSDSTCPVGERCVNALCRPMVRCASDGSCPAGKVCRHDPVTGFPECVPTCRSSAECPIGEVCSTVDGVRACRPGCRGDADCPPDARCDASQGICDRRPGACQTTDVCGACEACEAGSCRFAFDADFPDRRYCAACASPGPDADCGLGGFCIDGRCAPPCPEDGCPKGFLCQTLVDSSGTAFGRGCFPADGRCDTECL